MIILETPVRDVWRYSRTEKYHEINAFYHINDHNVEHMHFIVRVRYFLLYSFVTILIFTRKIKPAVGKCINYDFNSEFCVHLLCIAHYTL